MKLKNSDITLLCKVVDNYGDIGVVFRLAKSLSELLPDGGAGLRLIVDNLEAFAQLSPGVDVSKPLQEHRSWTVCQWDAASEGRKMYTERPPLVIVECFACGRPEWLDDILFDKSLQALRPKPVQIINLEYLTAEPYADEFHKLQSLTRSAQVRKVNFMPGFTDKTGGLILDGVPLAAGNGCSAEDAPLVGGDTPAAGGALCTEATASSGGAGEAHADTPAAGGSLVSSGSGSYCADRGKTFTVLVFSYERDFSTIADALASFATEHATSPQNAALTTFANLRVLVAAGKSDAPFSAAWKAACDSRQAQNASLEGCPWGNATVSLPAPEKLAFLPQDEWDKTLYSSDFLFIRGEDSLSRACLSGKPFVWHAYPQSEMYHLVKVRALLDRMEPFFSKENFRLIRDYWMWYNGGAPDTTDKTDATGSTHNASFGAQPSTNTLDATHTGYDSRATLIEILSRYDEMQKSFRAFTKNLIKNGNLAEHLMTFIEEIV